MLLFGHLGLGSRIVSPWTRGLPRKYVLIGTMLPDLIDKPLYYGLSDFLKKNGIEIISGTRTFGHTAVLLLVLAVTAAYKKSRPLAALTLGIASHLLLDSLGDSKRQALLWPWFDGRFPIYPYQGATDHLHSLIHRPYIFWGECLGLLLFIWDEWRIRYLYVPPGKKRRGLVKK